MTFFQEGFDLLFLIKWIKNKEGKFNYITLLKSNRDLQKKQLKTLSRQPYSKFTNENTTHITSKPQHLTSPPQKISKSFG